MILLEFILTSKALWAPIKFQVTNDLELPDKISWLLINLNHTRTGTINDKKVMGTNTGYVWSHPICIIHKPPTTFKNPEALPNVWNVPFVELNKCFYFELFRKFKMDFLIYTKEL